MYTSERVGCVGVTSNGIRIDALVAKKFFRRLSSTLSSVRVVRSDSVRATRFTLRSTATPDENSSVP
jgi:hypothetical protein